VTPCRPLLMLCRQSDGCATPGVLTKVAWTPVPTGVFSASVLKFSAIDGGQLRSISRGAKAYSAKGLPP
jgi:hypothetical protein